MADRTSARLFGDIFELIVDHLAPGSERDNVARLLWDKTYQYDFTPDQMGCDEALFALGFARRGVDPEYSEDGEVVLYDDLAVRELR